jgi:nitrite reductase (NADH) small subunit
MSPSQSIPDGYERVLASEMLPEGGARAVVVHGASLAIFRVRGRVYAISQHCPHADGPLADGQLQGTRVTCPHHGWEFDIRTGQCSHAPDRSVQTFPVLEAEGQIMVQA